jgi:DNA-binding NarL/FixJ family response regulator
VVDVTTDSNQTRAMRIAQRRIEGFAKQFGEAHRNLACHAAFPLVLTPDLLYQIWANFVPEAPWTAVAQVLLSRLCRQVGYEMYEMDIADRNFLLRELKEKFGQEKFDELGEFLLDYVAQRLTDDADMQYLREAQEWTALTYTKPDEAARELAKRLSERVQQGDMEEVLRLTSLVETLAEPLLEEGFEPLLVYGQGMKSFAKGDLVNAAKRFDDLSKNQSFEVKFNIPQIRLNQTASQNNGQKFLVVDDHKLVLSVTITILKEQYPNAEITSAETAQEALNFFENNQCLPNLVMTNLNMPHIVGGTSSSDVGIKFLKTLMQQYPTLNIVVHTAMPRALVRLKAATSSHEGGFTVADKSLPVNEFLTKVDWALKGLIYIPKNIRSGWELKSECLKVLRLAFEQSLTDKVIAQRMNVAERTVRHY